MSDTTSWHSLPKHMEACLEFSALDNCESFFHVSNFEFQITGDSVPLNLVRLNLVAIPLVSELSASDESSSVMLFSAEVSSSSSAVISFSAEVSSGAGCSSESGMDSLEYVAVWIVALCSSVSVDWFSAIWR